MRASSEWIESLWPSLCGLLVLGAAGCRSTEQLCLYQRDDESGFLRIEHLPTDGRVGFGRIDVETSRGEKQLREIMGDSDWVMTELFAFTPSYARVVVETNDPSYYRVVYDPNNLAVDAAAEVANKLGLEITREQRLAPAFVLLTNDQNQTYLEPFHGQPKWPEARESKRPNPLGQPELTYGKLVIREIKEFPGGGILFIRQKLDDDLSVADDDNLYFDGVSLDELAQYFEESRRFPVVNQTKDDSLYSFTLPTDISKQFTFDTTVPLPGLGLSVRSGKAEIDVIVVRDKHADKSAE